MANFERIIDLTPGTALQGDEAYEAVQPGNSSGASVYHTASQILGFVSGYGRNRLFNTNFFANRRAYVSSSALTAGKYGHDRWKGGSAGCTYTFTQSFPDTQITITAGSLVQPVEALFVEGGTYVISWQGTSTCKVNGAAAVSSPAVVTGLPSNTQINVEFLPGTLGQVYMDLGKVAVPYNRYAQPLENTILHRYAYKKTAQSNTDLIATLQAISGTNAIGKMFDPPLPFRATPAITLSSFSHLSIYNAAAGTAEVVTGGTLVGTIDSVQTPATGLIVASGLVAGNAANLFFNTTSGYILCDADI